MNLILYSVDTNTVQLTIKTLINYVLVFYYLLILSSVLVSLLHLLFVQTFMLPSPVTHP